MELGRAKRRIAKVGAFLLFALSWQLFAGRSGGLLTPTFLETVPAFFGLFDDAEFWSAFLGSMRTMIYGFSAALFIGVPLGMLIGRFRPLARMSEPYVNILLVTPMAAIIPLLVMSVGIGEISRVLLILIFSLPMVLVNTQVGVQQISPQIIEMGRSFGATERQLWSLIVWRAAMPSIMTGFRLGLGRAIQGVIVAELLMVAAGLGGLVLAARARFNAPYLYAVVAAVVITASLLVWAARWLERRVVPWMNISTGSATPARLRKARA